MPYKSTLPPHPGPLPQGERIAQHVEKADPFTEGLYQLVVRVFARLLFQECRYINREQDLRDVGLRSAKLSYHPVELVKKYLVRTALTNESGN